VRRGGGFRWSRRARADSTGEWIGSKLRFWTELEVEVSAADLAATLSWNKMGVVSTADLRTHQWDNEAATVHLLPRSSVSMRGSGGDDLLNERVWSEVESEKAVWIIAVGRMKAAANDASRWVIPTTGLRRVRETKS
jgi:hypothetical protein